MKNAKFCPHCGAELEAGVKFCSKCGYQLTDAADKATTQKTTTQATAESAKPAQQATPTTGQAANKGNGNFSERLDAMVNWVANNWATAIIIVAALLIFTLVTRAMFYNVWLGVIGLIAILVWLYSSAWTNGSGATQFEQKLRRTTQTTANTVNKTVNAQQSNTTDATARTTSQAAQPKMQQATTNGNQTEQKTAATGTQAQPTGQTVGGNTVYIQQSEQHSNGLGTAGFVLALIALFTSIIPFVDWVVWFLGALFSFIGLFRQPRGLAIAGFIISFIGIIIILTIATAIAGMLGIGAMM